MAAAVGGELTGGPGPTCQPQHRRSGDPPPVLAVPIQDTETDPLQMQTNLQIVPDCDLI